ncbi:TRAP transporter large permease subunit [Chloroflexota bacterium]
MMTKLLRFTSIGFDKILSASSVISIALMLLLSVLVIGLTISRYVLRINIPGLFDGAIYTLSVFPFLTIAYTMREKRHISVDVLTSKLPQRSQALLMIVTYLVSTLYIIVLCWKGSQWLSDIFRNNVHTEGVFAIPLGIIISVMVFGSFLLMLQMIRVIVQNVHFLLGNPSSEERRKYYWFPSLFFVLGALISTLLFIYVDHVIGITMLGLILLFSGAPVFLALGLVGCVGIFFLVGSNSLIQVPITAYKAIYSFPLSCLPLFILGGLIMEGSGIAGDMFRFFELWTGRLASSTILVTIAAGMMFCAISGSSSATTAVIAGVALPILVSRGFSKSLSCGAVAGATVGTLIPPSIGYVVYSVLTGESIGKLFMAGLIPSVILFSFYFLYVIILSRVNRKSLFENGQIPTQTVVNQVTWKDKLLSLRTAAWGLITPIIILGGIYFGIYTPTEAAAVLVIYSIIVAVFIKKTKWQTILKATLRSAVISSMILCIILSAYVFALVISQLRMASALVAYIEATGMSAAAILGIIFIVLMVLGLFVDAAAVKVITLPIFYPVAMTAGINGLWFGVFYQICNEIGLLTPPVGMNLFVIKGITGIPMSTVIRGCLPFVIMMVLTLVIIYAVPELVTWLPNNMN